MERRERSSRGRANSHGMSIGARNQHGSSSGRDRKDKADQHKLRSSTPRPNNNSSASVEVTGRRGGRSSVGGSRPPTLTVENLLLRLLELTDQEVVFSLQFNKNGLTDILMKLEKFKHAYPNFIKVLAKVCSCQLYQNNVMVTLQQLLASNFSLSLSNFIATTPFQRNVGTDWNAFYADLVAVLRRLFAIFPSNASQVLGPVISSAKSTADVLTKQMNLNIKYIEDLKDIEEQRISNLSKFSPPEQEKVSKEELQHATAPPDDYRQMSVVLCHSDVHDVCNSFLRCNIVKGSYKDVEHYLDVQFRLLREDFVASLRDGIVEYVTLFSRNIGREIKLKDLKIYHQVHIVMLDKSPYGGIMYKLQFDITKLKKINWEYTKRFLHGSLVCLSSDNFANFHLATVAKRDAKDLAKGLVNVKFLDQKDWELNVCEVYTMVESPTYFEAYEPILHGLKELDEERMPFIDTIVNANSNLNCPSYLNELSTYELCICDEQDFSCKPLIPTSWPSNIQLNLDESQHKALQAALTREIAIIQGPPGTGKTFLGLKIVQVLLDNVDNWKSNGNKAPILVICFTNHALDQFLEEILKFVPKGIVRVGGQSKSEKLKSFNINELKRNMAKSHVTPDIVYNAKRLTEQKIYSIADEINAVQQALAESMQRILSEDLFSINDILSERHEFQLSQLNAYRSGPKTKTTAIKIWLNLEYVIVKDVNEEDQNYQLRKSVASAEFKHENGDDDEESDYEDVLAEEEMAKRLDDDDDWLNDDPWRPDPSSKHNPDDEVLAFEDEVINEPDAEVWQKTRVERRHLKRQLKDELGKIDHMTEAEAQAVQDILRLSIENRWRLYRYWVVRLRELIMSKVSKLKIEYEFNCKRLKEVTQLFDQQVLKEAVVIGMTTTGAAKHRATLQQVQPPIVIVEEAAEVLETHVVTSLSKNCKHLILIGDQQQLRPSPTVYKLAKNYKMDVSLFERLINNDVPFEKLSLQHRMRPEIASLIVPNMYSNLENHASVNQYGNVKGMIKNVYFFDHQNDESAVADTKSKSNEFEANMIVGLCRYLLLQGYDSTSITILATYLGQVFLIKKKLKETIAENVRCTVVDNYQGEENDIILLSLVRSNAAGVVGFLKVENRVCVALSRARIGLYVTGNFKLLVENSAVWAPIAKKLLNTDAIGSAFQVICQNHPTTFTDIKSADDFQRVPEGGCLLPCEYRLPCGHKCEKVCHPIDKEHVAVECRKPCGKVVCDLGHICLKKCFQECGDCIVPIEKRSSMCGHINFIPCYLPENKFNCRKPCERTMICGHQCSAPCGNKCQPFLCQFLVKVKAPCDHTVTIQCAKSSFEKAQLLACAEPCNNILSCEHMCKGNCNLCSQGRYHVRCQEKCGRTLICGHSCGVPCAKTCPPCKKNCENRCIHSKCPLKCGVSCKLCVEPCAWVCRHKRCTKLCHEQCDRGPCGEKCPLRLPCGHPCIGHCGEPCPNQCRICNKDEVCEIMFGNEDDEDASFVLLEDCGHIIESTAMDKWMDMVPGVNSEINMKTCPKCKTVIRKSLRYGNAVKIMWNNVVTVKRRILDEHKKFRQTIQKVKDEATKALHKIPMFQDAKEQIKIQVRWRLNPFDVNLLQNKLKFLLKMKNLWTDESSPIFDVLRENLLELENILVFKLVYKLAAEEMLKNFAADLRRVELLRNLLFSVHDKSLNDKANESYVKIRRFLTDKVAFTEERENVVKELLKELKTLQTGLGISDAERIKIVTAMELSKGHWYKCPNGHVYVITECGGAMQRGKCPDCGAEIGGEQHRLLSTNRVATEMDGATRPAWP